MLILNNSECVNNSFSLLATMQRTIWLCQGALQKVHWMLQNITEFMLWRIQTDKNCRIF